MAKLWTVYWLYDSHCTNPKKHGYIGCTSRWPVRLHSHRYRKEFPKNYKCKVLFTGTEKEAFKLEEKFRPYKNLGWNQVKGGNTNKHKSKTYTKIRTSLTGKPKSKAHRKAIAKTLTGHTRTLTSRKKQSAAIRGIPKSPEQRAKMAEARRKWWRNQTPNQRAAYSATMSAAKSRL